MRIEGEGRPPELPSAFVQRDQQGNRQAALNGQRPQGRARQRAYLVAVGPEGDEEQLAELLTILIEDFEAKHYPLEPVSPRAALKELMEERGLRHADIWPVLGNKGVASEILNGKRSISKTQAKKLAEFFRVPLELFI